MLCMYKIYKEPTVFLPPATTTFSSWSVPVEKDLSYQIID